MRRQVEGNFRQKKHLGKGMEEWPCRVDVGHSGRGWAKAQGSWGSGCTGWLYAWLSGTRLWSESQAFLFLPVVERIMAPKDIFILIPGTYES